MNQKFSLTPEGLKALEVELKQLKDVARVANIRALQEARAQGDLSENADYDAARDQQAQIASRINEIEKILKNYSIIGGKWVKVEYLIKDPDFEPIQIYQVVGTLQANPLEGKISDESPLGKAVLDHKKGDEVTVRTENGEEYIVKILDVSEKEIKPSKKK